MREIAGAILVLAGAVLVAAGIVADAVTRNSGGYGNAGYVLGAVAGLLGLMFLFGRLLRRTWDAIPADGQRPGSTASGRAA